MVTGSVVQNGPGRACTLLASAADDLERAPGVRWCLLASLLAPEACAPALRARVLEQGGVHAGVALDGFLGALQGGPLPDAARVTLEQEGWLVRQQDGTLDIGTPPAPAFSLVELAGVKPLSANLAPLGGAGKRQLSDGWFRLGEARMDAKDPASAIPAYRHSVALRPPFTNGWFRLGSACFNAGEYTDAVDAYQQVVTLFPTSWNGWMWLGKALRKLQRSDEALAALERAVDVGDRQHIAWEELAHACRARGDTSRAAACMGKAIELAPDDGRNIQFRSRYLAADGRVDEAIAYLAPILERRPTWVKGLGDLGFLYYQAGDYGRAVAAYSQALAADPGAINSLFNRACARCLAGDRDGALEDLRATLAAEPHRARGARTDEDFASLRNDPEFLALFR